MSCTTCGANAVETKDTPPSDYTCPIRMADGRAFTDYRPRCHVQGDLYKMVGGDDTQPFSAYDARMYLQKNGESIIGQNRDKSQLVLAPCAPCKRPFNEPGTELPSQYVVRCNTVSCTRSEGAVEGLGDSRQYAAL